MCQLQRGTKNLWGLHNYLLCEHCLQVRTYTLVNLAHRIASNSHYWCMYPAPIFSLVLYTGFLTMLANPL